MPLWNDASSLSLSVNLPSKIRLPFYADSKRALSKRIAGVKIRDSALVAAANLSNRYISDRFLPDKAIDLVDEAASRLAMERESVPTENRSSATLACNVNWNWLNVN
jgi:hypothetical protein